jgi:Ca2+-binding EF-hand superfamily protein
MINTFMPHSSSREKAKEIIKKFDKNNDGKINFEEFYIGCLHDETLSEVFFV